MRSPADAGASRDPRLHPSRMMRWVISVALIAGCQTIPQDSADPADAIPAPTTTSSTPSIQPRTTTTPKVVVDAPPPGQRYVVARTEVAQEAKQLAVDIAYDLTNYEPGTDHEARLSALGGNDAGPPLADVSEPLTIAGSWSRGVVIYPQLGGLTADKASVMVVTRQTVGIGPVPEWSVLRTIDVRLVRSGADWEFDHLASAGGAFESIEDLANAHAIASDPRIDMPDSARIDILSGLVSPTLLDVMAELADRTDYAVTVFATGHPHNVFETDRQSHHTVGRAVDIYRIGSELVIDGRHDTESATLSAIQWMFDHPEVVQVGSPWDIDGPGSSRSFTNEVHQDHIHLAVRN